MNSLSKTTLNLRMTRITSATLRVDWQIISLFQADFTLLLTESSLILVSTRLTSFLGVRNFKSRKWTFAKLKKDTML